MGEEHGDKRPRVATPPITLNCEICGEKIYLSDDRWYHLNSGGRLCPLVQGKQKPSGATND